MSRFDAAIATGGLSETLGYFGQAAVYSPIDGPDVTLAKVSISPERTEQEDRSGLKLIMRKCEATISRDPQSADGGVANVTERGKLTFNSETWPITSIIEKTDAYTIVALERPEAAEHAAEGFRGPR